MTRSTRGSRSSVQEKSTPAKGEAPSAVVSPTRTSARRKSADEDVLKAKSTSEVPKPSTTKSKSKPVKAIRDSPKVTADDSPVVKANTTQKKSKVVTNKKTAVISSDESAQEDEDKSSSETPLAYELARTASAKVSALYGFDIITQYPRRADLIRYLRALQVDLAAMEQDVAKGPRGLAITASALISDKLLVHPDREVRVLVACCLTDILRIYAPDTPYKDLDTVRVFELLIAQIRYLETTPLNSDLGRLCSHVLISIATVKSCVVPVILAQSGVVGASELVVSLFQATLNMLRPEHTEEIFKYCAEILAACIAEQDVISVELLDLLLVHLLPIARIENPLAYRLVVVVIRSVADHLKDPLGKVLEAILLGATTTLHEISPEVAEEVYPLIAELHRIEPSLLLKVIPSLCQQLRVEVQEIRHKVVRLLTKLFASESSDYPKDFPRDFREFLHRITDLAVPIRRDMVEAYALLMKRRPELISTLEDGIVRRLRDHEEEIRVVALSRLIEVCQNHLEIVSIAAVKEIAERVKDRKTDVRNLALVGLSRLYWQHISGRMCAISDVSLDNLTQGISPEVITRLKIVPGYVLKAWGYPEFEVHHLIITLLQEQLLPRTVFSTENNEEANKKVSKSRQTAAEKAAEKAAEANLLERRATALLYLFSELDEVDMRSLGQILTLKYRTSEAVLSFLSAHDQTLLSNVPPTPAKESTPSRRRQSNRTSTSAQDESSIADPGAAVAMKAAVYHLSQLVPLPNEHRGKLTFFDRLLVSSDRHIYRLMEAVAAPWEFVGTVWKSQDELRQRLDSKTSLSEYIGTVVDVCGHLICSADLFELLVTLVVQLPMHFAVQVAEVAAFIAKHSPRIHPQSSNLLVQWLETALPFQEHQDESGTVSKTIRHSHQRDELLTHWHEVSISFGRYLEDDAAKESLAQCLTSKWEAILGEAKDVKTLSEEDLEIIDKLGEVICHVAYCGDCDAVVPARTYTTEFMSRTITKSAFSLTSPQQTRLLIAGLTALFSIPSLVLERSELHANVIHNLSYLSDRISVPLTIFPHLMQTLLPARDSFTAECRGEILLLATRFSILLESRRVLNGIRRREITEKLPFLIVSEVIFETLESQGETFAGVPTARPAASETALRSSARKSNSTPLGISSGELEDRKELLEAVTHAGLLLIRLHSFAESLSVEHWQELAWALLIDDSVIRGRLLNTLSESIQTYSVHQRFLAYASLFANDPELAEPAKSALVFAIRRLRKTQKDLQPLLISEQDPSRAARIQRALGRASAESIVPYLLYLLSYYPDFPTTIDVTTEDDRRRVTSVVRCVQHLISSLQTTLRMETGNLSFLFKQLTALSRDYVDRHDPENVGIHFVAGLTLRLLREQVKTVENMSVYPGPVTLPVELFELGAGAALFSRTLAHDGENGEEKLDKLLSIALRGGGRTTGGPVVRKRPSAEHHDAHRSPVAKQPRSTESVSPSRRLPTRATKTRVASYADAENSEESEDEIPSPRRSSKTVGRLLHKNRALSASEDEEEPSTPIVVQKTNRRRLSSARASVPLSPVNEASSSSATSVSTPPPKVRRARRSR